MCGKVESYFSKAFLSSRMLGFRGNGGIVSALVLTLGSLFMWKHSCFSPWLLGFPVRVWEGVMRRWVDGGMGSPGAHFKLISLKTNL